MDLSREVLATLYTAAPEDFLSVRAELAAAAKGRGEPQVGKQITAQRKPTLGAWVVNRQVHADPDCVDRLLDLGTRLRAAHDNLDAPALRELSTERRQLVAELTTAALTRAGRDDPPAALRDDVTGTFDAAVADPQVAARLGRLTRAEQWSGFGVATEDTVGVPELTVIRGGRDRPSSRPSTGRRGPARSDTAAETPTTPAEPTPRVDQAARRRARRARDKAADVLDTAEAALQDCETGQRTAGARIHELTAEISRLQGELDDAKRDQERFRREVKSARNRRREARSALDRAERQVERSD